MCYDVLIVEDNLTNIKLAELFLSELGYSTDKALNGQEALSKIAINNYKIIIMDLEMPVMDGKTAVKKIRSGNNQPTIPILAMTAHSYLDSKELQHCGFNDVLSKPINFKEIPKKFEKYCSFK